MPDIARQVAKTRIVEAIVEAETGISFVRRQALAEAILVKLEQLNRELQA